MAKLIIEQHFSANRRCLEKFTPHHHVLNRKTTGLLSSLTPVLIRELSNKINNDVACNYFKKKHNTSLSMTMLKEIRFTFTAPSARVFYNIGYNIIPQL